MTDSIAKPTTHVSQTSPVDTEGAAGTKSSLAVTLGCWPRFTAAPLGKKLQLLCTLYKMVPRVQIPYMLGTAWARAKLKRRPPAMDSYRPNLKLCRPPIDPPGAPWTLHQQTFPNDNGQYTYTYMYTYTYTYTYTYAYEYTYTFTYTHICICV